MVDRKGEVHLYLQISEVIRSRIVQGLSPGDLVTSEAKIQREFHVARTTARKAIRVLRDQGLVHTIQGEGTFFGSLDERPQTERSSPLYRYVADEIRRQIISGQLPPEHPVPGEVTLKRRYGVARETIRRGMAYLREEGWVYTIPHRGSYVSPRDQWPAEP
ncbi:winged helix-turn-helix transcriptional regulator [Nonomuraea sp. NN258]|uniref:GntR family transcriptional regulator n=1 Tax=Nonomuraea antri TaxID=2730852 RepID=UPI00156855F0|nr:winged helix-turn-helix domain-containing protein [Nonomuraea antri]NRQ33586.1 winged helix-turn-helix transcriptional regulator [Nonomuraea antri]